MTSSIAAQPHVSTDSSQAHAVFVKLSALWSNKETITYSFIGGTKNQHQAVTNVAVEWTRYADINLALREEGAVVRIGFTQGASWSLVGKVAQIGREGGPTMNFGMLKDSPDVSDFDRGAILQLWGYALGMVHDRQSPARGHTIALTHNEFYKYSRRSPGGDDDLINLQVLEAYHNYKFFNYSNFDKDSLMMYFMPGGLNDQGTSVPVSNELSDMDKAYMVINYTRLHVHLEAKEWTLEKALDVAGVPDSDAVRQIILSVHQESNSLRAYFAIWNYAARANGLPAPSLIDDGVTNLFNGILGLNLPDPSSPPAPPCIEHIIWAGLISALKNPTFSQVVSDVVNTVLAQNGLSYLRPPVSPNNHNPYGSLPTITDVFSNSSVMTTISATIRSAFSTHKPEAEYLQYGISSNLLLIVKHPYVHQSLVELVNTTLSQCAISPAAVTDAQYSAIKQGVSFGLVDVLKHPDLQKVVSESVGPFLAQYELKPYMGHSIFPDSARLLASPLISTTLMNLVNTALAEHCLKAGFAMRPEVLHGIWDAIGDVLNDHAFRKAVGIVIDATLKQHGVKTSRGTLSPNYSPSPEVQQGIWEGIIVILKNPAFITIINLVVDTTLTQFTLGSKPSVPEIPSHPNNAMVKNILIEVVNTAFAKYGHALQVTLQVLPQDHDVYLRVTETHLKSPVLRGIVESVIVTALKTNSYNDPAAPYVSVQQSLETATNHAHIESNDTLEWRGIFDVICHPTIQELLTSLIDDVLRKFKLEGGPGFSGNHTNSVKWTSNVDSLQIGATDVFKSRSGTPLPIGAKSSRIVASPQALPSQADFVSNYSNFNGHPV